MSIFGKCLGTGCTQGVPPSNSLSYLLPGSWMRYKFYTTTHLLILELQCFQWLVIMCVVQSHGIENHSLPCLASHTQFHLGDCWCLLSSLRQVTFKQKEGGSCLAISQLAIPPDLSLVMGELHVSTMWIPLHRTGHASLDLGIWGRWLTKSHFIASLITQGG